MDPFSIVAGVGGLAAVVIQSITLVQRYVKDAAGSNKQASNMVESLLILNSILQQLRDQLENSAKVDSLQSHAKGSILENTIESCHARVDTIAAKLLTGLQSHKLTRALRWPLDKKDQEEALRDLRMFAQWLQLSLTLQNGELLTQTLIGVNDLSYHHAQSAMTLHDVHCTLMPKISCAMPC